MACFEDDIAIMKAMRNFSSASLAKVVLYDQKTRAVFKRNMVKGCWKPIEEYLNDHDFCETPQQAFERFAKEYKVYEGDK
jgi:hypothetical protein